MCDNLKPDRIRCGPCRTINLAKNVNYPKPDMQISEKCTPTQRIECSKIPELPVNPTCIRVCSKEEYKLRKSGKRAAPKISVPHYAHGKFMYAVKAGILVGAVYYTYSQGVWGNQQEVTECVRRWQEYLRSINTRQPPTFDQCGRVIIYASFLTMFSFTVRASDKCTYEIRKAKNKLRKENQESLLAPVYTIYKEVITSCFSGVVKVPLLIKCAYIDYLKALERKRQEDAKIRRS